jgi:hypothetical protein
MQFMLLIYEDEEVYGGPDKSGPAMKAIGGRHMAHVKELGPVRVAGAGLKGTALATTVRTTNGKQAIHDGPFAETKEQLLGFYVIDCAALEEAVETARDLARANPGGAYEIRPIRLFLPGSGVT